MTNAHTLYVCYFGLREPLVQTQVLPYLREIKKDGTKVSILTFEPEPEKKWTKQEIEKQKRTLAGEGIEWDFLTYHKRFSAVATAFDSLRGALFVWNKTRREKIDVIHSRVHVPALMGALAKKFTAGKKPKLLFDIRGFFPEEYTDAGLWKENGLLYKSVKKVEKWLFRESDGFVVLTEKAREILFPESKETSFDRFSRPVEVIPCCVNLKRFEFNGENPREKVRRKFGIIDRKVVIYVGSFGGWYMTEEMLDFFSAARERDRKVFVMILTQRDKEKIAARLRERGFGDKDFLVDSVSPQEIPDYISAADIAISFIKPCYSKKSSSPTKIAEYLAGGVPIITNRGVGDVAEQIEADEVGFVIRDFDRESYFEAFDYLESKIKEMDMADVCRRSAKNRFDLEKVAGERYRRLYRRLTGV